MRNRRNIYAKRHEPLTIITFTAHLTHEQATALAQFVKRVGVTDLRPFAVDIDEAYLMRDGCDAVAAALADSGYRPR